MNLLLDTCVWGGACGELHAAGHDVVWAGEWEEDPGDEEILIRAHAEGRVLVTLDKDFGELAILSGPPFSLDARQLAKSMVSLDVSAISGGGYARESPLPRVLVVGELAK